MAKRALLTQIRQIEVELLDPEDWDGYEDNKPSDGWCLVRPPGGTRVWCGIYPFSLSTPRINDYSKVHLEVENG